MYSQVWRKLPRAFDFYQNDRRVPNVGQEVPIFSKTTEDIRISSALMEFGAKEGLVSI